MSGKYVAYPEYKDSEIDWVEKLPSHWELSKLRYMFSFGKGLTITKENLSDEGIPCVNYGEVHSKFGFEVNPEIHPLKCVNDSYIKSSPRALLVKGDIVFADTSEDIEGSGNFTQLTSDEKVFAGYHTIIARPNDRQCSRFYAYLLDSLEFRTQVRHAVKGVKVFSVTQAILRGINIWLPSLEERKKIANFLDRETAKIDTSIEKQQQLIKLLKEKRKAAISKAVTQGVNTQVETKDSGIDWLGKIPAHWDIRRAKFLFEEQNRAVREVDGIVTVFRDGQVCLRSRRRYSGFTMAVLEHGYQGIRKGDLVIHSMDAFAGAIGTSEDDGRATPEYVVVKPYNSKMNSEYYADILRLMAERDYIFVLCPSVRERAPRFRFSKFQQVLLPVPPTDEQDEIKSYLEDMLGRYVGLIKKAEVQIKLLQERRAALISAAVTGKIDVRYFNPGDGQSPEPSNTNNKEVAA